MQLGKPLPNHIPAPHGNRYENEETKDLFERIESDISELVARAYHLWVDRWATEPDSMAQFEVRMEKAKELHTVRQIIRQHLRSDSQAERKKGEKFLNELRQVDREQARQAAIFLALVGQSAARWLERLSNERLELLIVIAGKFGTWPVNLGMGKAKKTGKRDILRVAFAENYLQRLGLNSDSYWPETEISDETGVSPFRLAAEEVYAALRTIKSDSRRYFRGKSPLKRKAADLRFRKWRIEFNISPWGKRLLSLGAPMTKANSADWWSAAKVLLDEFWVRQKKMFLPLIEHLGLANPNYTPSFVKRRVIDDGLKKAFKSLAV